MIFVCFGILIISLILVLYANSLESEKYKKFLKYTAYGMVAFDILIAFFY